MATARRHELSTFLALAAAAILIPGAIAAQSAPVPDAPSTLSQPSAPSASDSLAVPDSTGATDEPTPATPPALEAPLATETAQEAAPDAPAAEAAETGETEALPTAPIPEAALGAVGRATGFLRDGGPAIWAIAALSVATVALILWKIWRFSLAGAWSRRASKRAVDLWERGQRNAALQLVSGRRGVRSRLTMAAMQARRDLSDTAAREETARVAKRLLAGQGGGLRALELIATVAPLLGLLGTVLGMIAAFQALQEAGNRADPAMLAGGIWEALLTTAAGMAVAIPASAALTWCEAVIDSIRTDMEDLAARIFVASEIAEVGAVQPPRDLAAE